MARILIGAAHTLESPGQIYGDLREADLTRNILKKVVPELEKLNLEFKPVPLDLQLLDRIEWINSAGYSEEQGDIFVEIHVNDGNKRGVESWYKGNPSSDNKSQILSEKINEIVCKDTGYENQGAKSEHDHELGSLLILNQINVIGTTVELLYIDNEEDIKILKDDSKLDELAKALAHAIEEYVKNTPKTSSTTTKSDQNSQPNPFQRDPFGSFGPTNKQSLFGGNSPTPAPKTSNLLMDRDERKKMINEIYKKVLGKDPSQSDLNLYLNQGISKEDLYIKLCDSPEHETLVKDAIESKEIKDKLNKTEAELVGSKGKTEDLNKMMENFNKLLHHKNTYITELQNELVKHNITKNGEYFKTTTSENTSILDNSPKIASIKQKKGLDDLIMKILRI